jgi:hypothetical protein
MEPAFPSACWVDSGGDKSALPLIPLGTHVEWQATTRSLKVSRVTRIQEANAAKRSEVMAHFNASQVSEIEESG